MLVFLPGQILLRSRAIVGVTAILITGTVGGQTGSMGATVSHTSTQQDYWGRLITPSWEQAGL
mgnify:CR=1 FL=1